MIVTVEVSYPVEQFVYPQKSIVDVDKRLRATLGRRPQYSVRDGVRHLVWERRELSFALRACEATLKWATSIEVEIAVSMFNDLEASCRD